MRTSVSLLTVVVLIMSQARAERVPLSQEQQKAEATHIVTGTVKAVYSREVETTQYGKGTLENHFLVEIEVQAVEKGNGLKKGDLVYVRCWRLKRRGADRRPGPSGHFSIPGDGDRIRAFLAKGKYGPTGQSDNGWAVVYPNGFVKQPSK